MVRTSAPEVDAEAHEDCQLGEEFLQQLNRTLERYDIESSGWQMRRGKWRQLASEFSKWVWYLGGLFAQIDLFGGHQEEPTNRHYGRWSHHENFDRRFTRLRLKWWPYVSLPLYTISSLRLLINIYYQYVYDFNFIRQQVFLALTGQATKADVSNMLKSHLDSPFVQTILAAQERLASAAAALVSPGRPTLLNFSSSIGNSTSNYAAGGKKDLPPPPPVLLEHGQQVAVRGQQQPLDLSQLGTLLDARVTEAYATMKLIGAPYIVMTFEVQIVYFFLLAASFVLIVLLTVHYRYRSPFDFSLVRAVLDFKHERRLFNRLIVHELNRFISSSRNFTLACVEQSRWFASKAPDPAGQTREQTRVERRALSIEKAHARSESNRFLLDHALIRKQLQQMALSGQLLPEHRTEAWVDSLSLKFIGFAVGSMGYIFLATLFFAFIFFALSDEIFIDAVSYMDVLTICEAGVLVVLVVPNAVIQICIMVATSIDQICYSTNVCRRVRECIQVNQRRFHEICEMQLQSQLGQRRTGRKLKRLQKSNFNPHYEQSSSSLSYGQLIDDSKLALVMRRRSGTQSTMLSSSSSSAASGSGGGGGGDSEPQMVSWTRGRRGSRVRAEPGAWHLENESNSGSDALELFNRDLLLRDEPDSYAAYTELEVRAPLDHTLGIESRCTQMNVDLLHVFITYKIFVAQMRQTTRSFVIFTLACVTLIIVSPLQVRIHSPYFSQFTKLMAMLFSLLGTTAVDSCLILLCYMFARCTEIYRSLSSLLAHAVEVMNYSPNSTHTSGSELTQSPLAQGQQQQQIYDTHTIWLLRKELNFPDRVVGQFAIVAYDFRLTYSNLLKIHFWIGLLTLSIFVDDSSSQEFFGRLFNDPFGVFDWP